MVSPRRSFWEWCHTHTKLPLSSSSSSSYPDTSQLLGSGQGAEVEKEQHSYEPAAGLAVMDELILANIQTPKRARPLTSELPP